MHTSSIRLHWFFFIAPLLLAVNMYVGLSSRGQVDRLIEAGLLFDLAVLIPCLYWLCYRSNGKKTVIRGVALVCLGIWVSTKLVPVSERDLLNYVAPIRYVGLAALIWLELAVIGAIYKTVFKGGSVSDAVSQASTDMPTWVAKLLAMEANFWLRVWAVVKRYFAGK